MYPIIDVLIVVIGWWQIEFKKRWDYKQDEIFIISDGKNHFWNILWKTRVDVLYSSAGSAFVPRHFTKTRNLQFNIFFQSLNKKVSTIFIKMAKNASSFVYSVIIGCAPRIIDSSTLEKKNKK